MQCSQCGDYYLWLRYDKYYNFRGKCRLAMRNAEKTASMIVFTVFNFHSSVRLLPFIRSKTIKKPNEAKPHWACVSVLNVSELVHNPRLDDIIST